MTKYCHDHGSMPGGYVSFSQSRTKVRANHAVAQGANL
jgi:hypothetical protein